MSAENAVEEAPEPPQATPDDQPARPEKKDPPADWLMLFDA